MKFFTADIWAGWQGSKTAFERACKRWDKNLAEYNANLGRLAARLGRGHGLFFTKHSLHDGDLLLFAISDWPGPLPKRSVEPVTSVEIVVLAGRENALIYRLFYSGVEEISIRTKNSLFPLEYSRFGDWGYDELLAEKKGVFRHNILFQTATEISIAFRGFRFEVERASAAKLKRYARPARRRVRK
jgi:hypothetical protein